MVSSYYLTNMSTIKIIFIILSITFISCDKGLSPDLAAEKSGFGGKVTFIGDWDPSISQTHVVIFKNPLLSVSDFNIFNLSFVSESIPNGSLSYDYSTNDDNSLTSTISSGTYSYIAVAQSIKDTITLNREDWFIVGLYADKKNIVLTEGEFISGIDIFCDFNNPPPQPPGGSVSKDKLNLFMSEILNKGMTE